VSLCLASLDLHPHVRSLLLLLPCVLLPRNFHVKLPLSDAKSNPNSNINFAWICTEAKPEQLAWPNAILNKQWNMYLLFVPPNE
jgi:hypothetical protein